MSTTLLPSKVTPMISKEKKKPLSLHQKLEVLQKLTDGITTRIIAKEYDVTPLVIQRIRKNKNQLLQRSQMWRAQIKGNMRKPKFVDLDARLYSWYMEEKAKGGRIPYSMLQRRANELNVELGGPSSFRPSVNWVWRFKLRHGIPTEGKLHDNANVKEAETFYYNLILRCTENNIALWNLYNMDEVNLMWKALPRSLSASTAKKKRKQHTILKDRVTVAFCANATGTHKLPPLVIYRYRPKALKHCSDQESFIFKSQKDGCMDRDLFIDWLVNCFKPAVIKEQLEKGFAPEKVFLLVDDSLFHIIPPEFQKTDKYEVIVFPKNTSELLQPSDQGITSKIKKLFRLNLLNRILYFSGSIREFLDDYDIKDCIDMVQDAWMSVTDVCIRNSWRNIVKGREYEQDAGDETCVAEVDSMRDIINKITHNVVSKEEIKEWLTSCEEAEVSDYSDKEENLTNPRLLDRSKLDKTFTNLLLWAKKQPDSIEMRAHMLTNYWNRET